MTIPSSMNRPWNWRLTWAPPDGECQELVLQRHDAVVLSLELRARFGADFPIAVARQRQGDEGEWLPSDWWAMWHDLRGRQRYELRQRPVFVAPRMPGLNA